jgi:hypothetical protein
LSIILRWQKGCTTLLRNQNNQDQHLASAEFLIHVSGGVTARAGNLPRCICVSMCFSLS